jgi:uncharacterized protein (TIGR03083 family)
MIQVLHLFPKLNSSLIEVLESLSADQWANSTICKQWKVKDIAAHLLDTSLRRLSYGRDGHILQAPEINSYAGLLLYLNTLNADWVNAYKRVSQQVLLKQISTAQDELTKYLGTVDLSSPAPFPVSWAGEDQSLMWFDIAREYTECWHHQQQIRQAVGASSILDRDLYLPFLEISMLALPYHYKSKSAAAGTVVKIDVVGDAGGSWSIIKGDLTWEFTSASAEANTQVYIDQNIAWMLLSKGIDIFEAEQYWQVSGDYELGFHALKMTAFMV